MRVTKSLENRRILLKETSRKTAVQEGEFLDFLRSLMTACLPQIKRVITPSAKSVSIAADAAIQKKIYKSEITTLITSIE